MSFLNLFEKKASNETCKLMGWQSFDALTSQLTLLYLEKPSYTPLKQAKVQPKLEDMILFISTSNPHNNPHKPQLENKITEQHMPIKQ